MFFSQGHQLSQHIVRKYDIRGRFEQDLHKEDAFQIGFRFASWILKNSPDTHSNSIVISRDCRIHGGLLKHYLSLGIRAAGMDVIDIGIATSPLLYYWALKSGSSGISVTGSHNPIEYNGFKFYSPQVDIDEDIIQEIAYHECADQGRQMGSVSHHNPVQKYVEECCQILPKSQKLRIGIDPLEGAAGHIVEKAKALIETAGHEIFIQNTSTSGLFSNVYPDPSKPANLQMLQDLIARESLDFGIAFDGDGDRIVLIDRDGKVISGDILMLILVRQILQENLGAGVVFDVKCSNLLSAEIIKYGGNPIVCQTGHSFIKKKIHESGALFGGEVSGHIYFADKYYGFDDALYCGLRLISFLSQSSQSLAEILSELPKSYISDEIKIKTEDNFAIIERIKDWCVQKGIKFNDLDGVKMEFENSWLLLRASNTEPAINGRYEAFDEKEFARLGELLKDVKKLFSH